MKPLNTSETLFCAVSSKTSSEAEAVKKMAEKAKGDVEAFRQLYRGTFNCEPALLTEKEKLTTKGFDFIKI